MPRLQETYRKEVVPALKEQLKIANIMAVPKIEKVVVNTGIGKLAKDDKAIKKLEKDISLLSGQKAVFRKSRKSISGFKLREGMDVGISVTMRGKRMYDFIDRLISIALPRSKDFRGIDPKNIDAAGNLNLGVKEHNIFPEVTYESTKDIFGLQVTVVTNAKNKEQGLALFKLLGFPFKHA